MQLHSKIWMMSQIVQIEYDTYHPFFPNDWNEM